MKRPITAAILTLSSCALINLAFGETQAEHFTKLTEAARQANTKEEPVAPGKFQPTWESLKQYEFPEWFRDAKFGIWAHWGPQCEPEKGDWYARNMYSQLNKKGEPNPIYEYHVNHYGHPSVFGFKDIIPLWKAEKWDPEKLVALYKKSGAKYFMALANHHDNFDTWDSKYQPWNSTNLGPHRDLIAGWAKACKEQGLPFGVSVHAARAWGWNDVSKGSDNAGPKAGVPYDGNLTAADGKGLWWDGLDPQADLYAQNHGPKDKPTAEYMRKFFNRTMDLVNRYNPDMVYFDDDISRGLPLYNDDPSIGLRIAAHFYNSNMAIHDGKLTAVIAAKKLADDRKKSILFDIERGGAPDILSEPWQTDTCIGTWHYDRSVGEHNGYKKPSAVIPMLADIVSKNGNLMLSIPVRSDGSIDENEVHFLNEIGSWLSINGKGIYATRPWKVYGEGPSVIAVHEVNSFGGIKDVQSKPYTAADIRFTTSKDAKTLYAIALGWPTDGKFVIKSLAEKSPLSNGEIKDVTLLGCDQKLLFSRDETGLVISLPDKKPCDYAYVFSIETK